MKNSLTTGIVLVSLLVAATAFGAAQDKDQQKCIGSLNKGMNKVSVAQLKANAKCVSDFAKAKNMSAFNCYIAPPKVTTAENKNCASATKKCSVAPTLGPTMCNNVNFASRKYARFLVEGVLPDGGVSACSSDKPGCKCQGKVLKGSNKLFSTLEKEFNKCKKAGLKNKTTPISDVAGLNACLGSDPKNKIAKALTKLDGSITKGCPGTITNPMPMGQCAMLTGAALRDCLNERIRCEVCLTARDSDGLSIDCDIFNDATDDNDCFDPS